MRGRQNSITVLGIEMEPLLIAESTENLSVPENEPKTLLNLPADILVYLMRYLDTNDLIPFMLVCKETFQLFHNAYMANLAVRIMVRDNNQEIIFYPHFKDVKSILLKAYYLNLYGAPILEANFRAIDEYFDRRDCCYTVSTVSAYLAGGIVWLGGSAGIFYGICTSSLPCVYTVPLCPVMGLAGSAVAGGAVAIVGDIACYNGYISCIRPRMERAQAAASQVQHDIMQVTAALRSKALLFHKPPRAMTMADEAIADNAPPRMEML